MGETFQTSDFEVLESFRNLLKAIVDQRDINKWLANDSCYGLTASVWTKDRERGRKVAAQLDVGNVTINGHAAGGLGCPWGGAKESGIGRTNTKDGQRQFANAKYIHEIFSQ